MRGGREEELVVPIEEVCSFRPREKRKKKKEGGERKSSSRRSSPFHPFLKRLKLYLRPVRCATIKEKERGGRKKGRRK